MFPFILFMYFTNDLILIKVITRFFYRFLGIISNISLATPSKCLPLNLKIATAHIRRQINIYQFGSVRDKADLSMDLSREMARWRRRFQAILGHAPEGLGRINLALVEDVVDRELVLRHPRLEEVPEGLELLRQRDL